MQERQTTNTNNTHEVHFNYEIVIQAFLRLIEILEKDKDFNLSKDSSYVKDTHDEREDIIMFLYNQREVLRENPNIITPEQKKRINELNLQLKLAADNSLEETNKALFVTTRVINILKSLVTREKNRSMGYNLQGKKIESTKFSDTPSIALNQQL